MAVAADAAGRLAAVSEAGTTPLQRTLGAPALALRSSARWLRRAALARAVKSFYRPCHCHTGRAGDCASRF